jgi:hypothetical protein
VAARGTAARAAIPIADMTNEAHPGTVNDGFVIRLRVQCRVCGTGYRTDASLVSRREPPGSAPALSLTDRYRSTVARTM